MPNAVIAEDIAASFSSPKKPYKVTVCRFLYLIQSVIDVSPRDTFECNANLMLQSKWSQKTVMPSSFLTFEPLSKRYGHFIRFKHYGRYNNRGPLTLTFSTRCGSIRSYTSFTHSHRTGLVSRGSIISEMSKTSAVRIGERTASNLAIRLSYSLLRLSPAASSSRRYAA